MRFCAMTLCLSGLLLTAGCGGDAGPKLHEAGGVVTFNGTPLANATVSFAPAEGNKAPLASAITDSKGEYRLKARGDAGAAEGTYTVTVTKFEGADELAAAAAVEKPANPNDPEAAMAKMAADMKKMQPDTNKAQNDPTGQSNVGAKAKSLIPEKYGSPKFSGLTFTVKSGDPNNLKLDIKLAE